MAFNGTEGGTITEEAAVIMTVAYRDNISNNVYARFFGRDCIEQLLNQPGAMGIRIHYGMDANGDNQLIMVAANAEENDMSALIMDMSTPTGWPPKAGTFTIGLNLGK